MKIVVAYKWAANPQDTEVGPDGTVDWSRAKASFGEYDAVAVELGRRLADATGGELIGVSVGGPDVEAGLARKGALSRGLDRLVLVADAAVEHADTMTTAAVLAAVVARIGEVDLVLTGDASTDVAAKMVPGALAARLGWAALAECSAPAVQDGAVCVRRSAEGATETVRVPLPAVLAVASDAVVPRVPGMKDILAAAKKPVEVLALAGLDVAPAAAPAAARLRRPQLPSRKNRMLDASDPQDAARALVGELRSAGVL